MALLSLVLLKTAHIAATSLLLLIHVDLFPFARELLAAFTFRNFDVLKAVAIPVVGRLNGLSSP